MRVEGLAMMWRAKFCVPLMGGKTFSLIISKDHSPETNPDFRVQQALILVIKKMKK